MPLWLTIVLIFALSLPALLLCIALQPGDFARSFVDIWTRKGLFLLNWFPVLITLALGYFITGNVWWGSAIATLLWPLLSYINLLKIEGREDTFVPADIGLFKEALNAAAEYSLDLHPWWLVTIIGLSLGLVAVGFFLGSSTKGYLRVVGSVGAIGLFALSMLFVYPAKSIYNSYTVPDSYNIPSVFNTLGFNYCFLYNTNLYPVEKPEDYNKKTVEGWMEEYTQPVTTPETAPNIIMVMGEAFSDIANADVFDWPTEQDNPIYLYNQLTQSKQALSGHIAVSNIAAGTANTEFDILTGLPTTMIGEGATSSFRVVHGALPTVASVLRDQGYHNRFMHPGNSWFYNRSSVYKYFGIEQQTFKSVFDPTDEVGGFVKDSAFLRQLKTEIEAGQSPQFIYSVTIQNHQSYKYHKYPDATPAVPTDVPLSDEAMEQLSVYLRGSRDTATMVSELVQYLDGLSRPTLLVFFGDHLPNLGSDYLAYRELGLPVGNTDTVENIFSAYSTPFLIYANKAYCAENDFTSDVQALELGEEKLINSVYLGAMTLELAGYEGLDPYFDFLNQSRRALPAFRAETAAYLTDAGFTDTLPPATADLLHKIDHWEYYRLKN